MIQKILICTEEMMIKYHVGYAYVQTWVGMEQVHKIISVIPESSLNSLKANPLKDLPEEQRTGWVDYDCRRGAGAQNNGVLCQSPFGRHMEMELINLSTGNALCT
eukprot:SAG22_NODE_66_length_22936_cov_626.714279_2_plen_105_part_00